MISDHNIVQSNNTKDLGLILRPNPSCEETLFFRSHLILLYKDKQRPGQGLHPANRHEREPPPLCWPVTDRFFPWATYTLTELGLTQEQTVSSQDSHEQMTPRFTLSLAHFSLLRADNIKANHLLVKGCEYTYFFLNYTLFL